MESFRGGSVGKTPAPQEKGVPVKLTPEEKEQKRKEIDAQIEAKKAEWKKIEERNYNLRMNSSADGKGRPVDLIKLDQGDVVERDLHNAYMSAKKTTQYQMDSLQEEIKALEAKKTSLF